MLLIVDYETKKDVTLAKEMTSFIIFFWIEMTVGRTWDKKV
jgi:hypothetical protein